MEVWHRGGGSWRAQPAGDPRKGKAVTAPRVLQARPGVCSPAVSVRVPDAHCTLLLGAARSPPPGKILALPPLDSGPHIPRPPCRADWFDPLANADAPAAVTPARLVAPQTHPRGAWGG